MQSEKIPVRGTKKKKSVPVKKRAVNFFRKWKLQLVCIVSGLLLFLLASRFLPAETDIKSGNRLLRNGYGRQTETYEITVEGLEEKPVKVEIPVSARKYADEDIGRAFDACMDYLSVQILGDNPSLTEISGNLNLMSSVPKFGMRADWTSPDSSLVDSSGTVKNTELKEPRDIILKVRLSDGSGKHTTDYELPVKIIPKNLSEQEKQYRDFLSFLKQEDKTQATGETFTLPDEYDGKKLNYSQKSRENYNILWVLGIACAVLFYLRDRFREKDAIDYRNRQLLLDYPEIVSKLMVFIGAGMTIRLAWENIVNDYETGKTGKRFAYEEMSRSLSQLKTGVNEGKVYRDFGRSCGLKQYMKLSGILEQNRKTGIADIRNILHEETSLAWEERKTIARRMGEEASTKLIAPLMIMLLIVMVMIIVPAMMSFA
jgi:tight adherence protein C